MKPRNVGEALLLRLRQLGVEFLFANPGTEFVSVIRGFSELPADRVPAPVLAAHEAQAVGMAYGCYLGSGRPQAVMTHAGVGAANALIGLIGAARMNVPLIFISGMTPQSERGTPARRDKLIHWAQDARDQAGLFREYVKWEAELRAPSAVHDLLDRAYAIAMSEPRGPVAVTISRDILMAECAPDAPLEPSVRPLEPAGPDAAALDRVARWLADARRPLVVTNRLGSDPDAVALLRAFSERHCVGVLTPEDYYLSFPSDHPHHLGYKPCAALREADLLLVLDTDAPWSPLENGPPPGARVVHAGPDPLFQTLPLRSHRGDLFLPCAPRALLSWLEGARAEPALLESRRRWIASSRPTRPARPPASNALTTATVSAALAGFLGPDTVLVNELGLAPEALDLRHPGGYFRSGAASPLGWGLSCALGLRLAAPRKTVIATVGDGAFYLSPLFGVLMASVQLGRPFVTVVLDNGGLGSIAKTARDHYPGLPARPPLTAFAPADLELCAQTVSGLGLRADDAAQLRAALERGLEFCRSSKRPAVIRAVLAA